MVTFERDRIALKAKHFFNVFTYKSETQGQITNKQQLHLKPPGLMHPSEPILFKSTCLRDLKTWRVFWSYELPVMVVNNPKQFWWGFWNFFKMLSARTARRQLWYVSEMRLLEFDCLIKASTTAHILCNGKKCTQDQFRDKYIESPLCCIVHHCFNCRRRQIRPPKCPHWTLFLANFLVASIMVADGNGFPSIEAI